MTDSYDYNQATVPMSVSFSGTFGNGDKITVEVVGGPNDVNYTASRIEDIKRQKFKCDADIAFYLESKVQKDIARQEREMSAYKNFISRGGCPQKKFRNK